MQLLSPDDVRKERSESAEEAAQRARALAAEESRLARAINQARADAEQQIKLIETDFEAFKKDILEHKDRLISEVRELENRRSEALKPVEPIKEAAEKALAEAEAAKADAARQTADLAADREKNQEHAEALRDRSDELDRREARIEHREKTATQEEARQQQSAKILGDKWGEYYVAVTNLNTKIVEIERRAAEVEAAAGANETRAHALREYEGRLNERQQGLEDGYNNLQRAREEILGRKE